MYFISLGVGIVILFLIIRGAFKGFSGELASLAGLAAGGCLIWFGFDPVQRSIAFLPQVSENASRYYAALGIFIVGLLLFLLVSHLVKKVGEKIIPQPFNAILGGIIGAVKALFFISIISGSILLIRDYINEISKQDLVNPAANAMMKSWQEMIIPDFKQIIFGTPSESSSEQSDGER